MGYPYRLNLPKVRVDLRLGYLASDKPARQIKVVFR